MTTPPAGLDSRAADPSGMIAQVLIKQGEMSTQLAVVLAKMEVLPDHESRIRQLERWRYALPLSALGTIASLGLAVAAWLRR